MCRSFPIIRKPKDEPEKSELNAREVVSAILGNPNTLIEDLDAHLDKLRKMGYSETSIEKFRSRLNIGEGEAN